MSNSNLLSQDIIELNCVLFGDGPGMIFAAEMEQDDQVSDLKRVIRKKAAIGLKFASQQLALFQVNLAASEYNSLGLASFMAMVKNAVPEEPLLGARELRAIFPFGSPGDHALHIVAFIPDGVSSAPIAIFSCTGQMDNILRAPDMQYLIVHRLEDQHKPLFQHLKVSVSKFGSWSRSDTTKNMQGGDFFAADASRSSMCAPLLKIEEQLARQHTYTNSGSLECRLARELYPDHFNRIYVEDSDSSEVSDREFAAFFNILRLQLQYAAFTKEGSPGAKASYLSMHFMLPPFSDVNKRLQYQVKMLWNFPLFVACVDEPELCCQYTPKPNITVESASSHFPFVISSSEVELDRERMLIQAIAIARAGQYLINSDDEQFFVVAIYLCPNLTAERYIVAQTEAPNEKVSICQRDFDLGSPEGAVLFLREMYNLAARLEELAGEFDPSRSGLLGEIQQDARDLLSLTAVMAKKSNESEKSGESDEDGDSDDDPNDDDIFNADDIQDILEEIGYKINFIPFGYPRVAVVLSVSDDSKIGFLKFVRERQDSEEIPILKYLSEIDSPRNHTVAGAQFWPVRGGQVISMPSAGSWITYLRDPDAHLWSAAGQLFEAVDFMHQHGVAHLDLKPENVLMPLDGGRLSIIDFHTSVRVEGVGTTFTGVVGTRGYIPPEVIADRGAFSAVRADLWSCGKTLSKLCDLCRPSADRDVLLQIARELMDEDPERRPVMSDVLERMADIRPIAS